MKKNKKQKQPVDIEQKRKLAGQVARAHDLLIYGTFQGSLAKDVLESREFLAKLNEEMIKEIEQAEAKPEDKTKPKAEAEPSQEVK